MTDDQQRARELLAAEYERMGWPSLWARMTLSGEIGDFEKEPQLAAITAALRAAPDGPATHYHCKDGIHGTVRRLRRYSTTATNRNSLQGQTMEEAAAFIEYVLAARPQGASDA